MSDRSIEEPGSRSAGSVARHIERVAAELFASKGYDATPVRMIVEAAGVTKPTLYYHFGSKEGLAQALVTRPLGVFLAAVRRALDESADPVEAMAGVVRAHFDFMVEDPDRGRFFYALFFGPHDSSLAAELEAFGAAIGLAFFEAVGRLVDSGRVDPARAARFATACRGTIVGHTMDYLYNKPGCNALPRPEIGPELARAIVDDLLQGFRPSPTFPDTGG